LGFWTHAAGVEETILIEARIGFLAGAGYRRGRLKTGMGVQDGVDVTGEQFKVFFRHAVAPLIDDVVLYPKLHFMVNHGKNYA